MREVIAGLAIAGLVALAGCAGKTGRPRGNAQSEHKGDITKRATHGDPIPDIANTVYFYCDKSLLRPEAQPVLGGVAQWLRRYPDLADPHRRPRRRARHLRIEPRARQSARHLRTSVRNYLVSLGIPAQRLAPVSYGKERPAIAGSSEETWSQNRRAVAEVQ